MLPAAWLSVLSRCEPAELLSAFVRTLAFGEPAIASRSTCRALGLPDYLQSVRLAAAQQTLRLMFVVTDDSTPAREHAVQVAGGLSNKAPHLLWLLVVIAPARFEVVVAAWHAGTGTPRVAALVVDGRYAVASDAEIVRALSASQDDSDVVTHARWVEVLGREAISRRFFFALQGLVTRLATRASGRAPLAIRRDIALLHVSRLLFLAFLEERGWLDGDRRFLARTFDACMERGGQFQRRVLEPLFFGTLNTPPGRRAALARSLGRIPFLNGGLFTRAPVERLRDVTMHDEDWSEAFDSLLLRYRFTPREENTRWHEAAIDPEILGRAFESLMASAERHATGAFYTPLTLVARVTDTALESILMARGVDEGTLARVVDGTPLAAREMEDLCSAVKGLRVLDPACGSGAFLVHAVERLTQLGAAAGDSRSLAAIRRDVVSHAVFGVDVNPMAVWLCELRLWLALVVDHPATDPMAVPPLPNLDHNIRCGDTLAGGDFSFTRSTARRRRADLLRARYARATGARKKSLARELDRAERAGGLHWLEARLAEVTVRRRSLVAAARGRDLFGGRRGAVAGERDELRHLRMRARELRAQHKSVLAGNALPFAFAAQFPDAVRAGGFDMVMGNPPWIRLHRIPAVMRDRLRRDFRVFREAAWLPGAKAARAGSGFGSQVDAASLFVERGHQLLRPGGVLAMLVPSKLWRALAGGGVRRLLTERSHLIAMEDWAGAPAMFDAATYPSIVVASVTTSPPAGSDVRLAVHRGRVEVAWRTPRSTLPLDQTAGAPWITLPPEARLAFDRLTCSGVPLAESGLGVATLGVKCGCNQAFLVRAEARNGTMDVTDGSRTAVIDPRFVRPVLRGESVTCWRAARGAHSMVYPYDESGRLLNRLPPDLRGWLLPWRSRLESRTDARGTKAWWSLFRLEGSRPDLPRVVWADLGRSLQALVLNAGDDTIPLNTCYVLATKDLTDAQALAALLNSPVADSWVGAVAEPARGGYRRHFAWTMARLPVPDDWARARDILAPLGERGMRGDPPGRAELTGAVLDAFRIRQRTIAPLLEWMNG